MLERLLAIVMALSPATARAEFWSFVPARDVSPPSVKNQSWPQTPIDRFIAKEHEARGLSPVERADKRTLIRRATFDLTGLPPTPSEIEAFLHDGSPTAIAAMVDRLLASRAYGERWGRHWLDVVRYADTAGDNSDYPIPQHYMYRDWVIRAIGRDMPYDQFVREQIAGDLMPSPDESQRRERLLATGYLANSKRFGSYEDERYPWHLTIEDTIDNFGRTFLALTINCARCHDHKFDPLTQEDYYALYGFFSSTRYPRPGIELDKVQRDFVPLATAEQVQSFETERKRKLSELDAKIKQLEKDKAGDKAIKEAKAARERFEKQPLPFDTIYAVAEGKTEGKRKVGNACIHIKGDPEYLGKEVPRRFIAKLGGRNLPANEKGSGRLELATWLTDPANPLFARVMVNRIWHFHFGKGLVPTPSDFGKQGRPPTHPELLDYLAKRFIDSGWSIKAMHRLIMNSRAYQISSSENESNSRIDVANDYYWRFPRHRLDAESIRDSLLAVSGNLDRSPGGPHPFPPMAKWDFTQHNPFKAVYDHNRRSVYLMTQRIQRHPFLGLFDGADTNASTAKRITSTTPLQALFLMNDPFVHGVAQRLAAQLRAEFSSDKVRIDRAFALLFGRSPRDDERELLVEYLEQIRQKLTAEKSQDVEAKAWESAVRALLMNNEFVYVN